MAIDGNDENHEMHTKNDIENDQEPECDVPVPGFLIFWWYRNKLVPEKSLGTNIGKIGYQEKVSEPVSEEFST